MSGMHPEAGVLNSYLLDELDPSARRAVEVHLAGCADCRESVARLRTVLAAYRDAEPAAAEEGALARLQARPRSGRREWPRRVTVAVAAAAAVVIFMGGFWTGRGAADRESVARARRAPAPAGEASRTRRDRDPPPVTFAVADADLLGGLAPRDTTWN